MQFKGGMGEFLDKVEAQGYPINLGMLAGAWYLRLKTGAADKRKPADAGQVERLAALAEEAIQQGAFGVPQGDTRTDLNEPRLSATHVLAWLPCCLIAPSPCPFTAGLQARYSSSCNEFQNLYLSPKRAREPGRRR
jgi:hypothetical protein